MKYPTWIRTRQHTIIYPEAYCFFDDIIKKFDGIAKITKINIGPDVPEAWRYTINNNFNIPVGKIK